MPNERSAVDTMVQIAHDNFRQKGSKTHVNIDGLGWMEIDALTLAEDKTVLSISAHHQPEQFLTVDPARLIAVATNEVSY